MGNVLFRDDRLLTLGRTGVKPRVIGQFEYSVVFKLHLLWFLSHDNVN